MIPRLATLAGAVSLGLAGLVGVAHAQPLLTSELADRTVSRDAIEAAIWVIPAVNYDAMYQVRDTRDASNQLVYWSRLSDWKNQR
jgi:hypothetical protein